MIVKALTLFSPKGPGVVSATAAPLTNAFTCSKELIRYADIRVLIVTLLPVCAKGTTVIKKTHKYAELWDCRLRDIDIPTSQISVGCLHLGFQGLLGGILAVFEMFCEGIFHRLQPCLPGLNVPQCCASSSDFTGIRCTQSQQSGGLSLYPKRQHMH